MIPELAVRLHKKTSTMGFTSFDPNIPWLELTMLVCTACAHVECFATNGVELQQIPGARLVQASGGT